MVSSAQWLKAALALALLAFLVAGGAWFYRAQQQLLRRQVEDELASIAQLKVDQIAAWREECLAEGSELAARRFLSERLAGWLLAPEAGEREALLAELRGFQRHAGCADVLVVDLKGQVCLSLSGRAALDGCEIETLATVWRERVSVLTDLHPAEADRPVHISVIAPILAGEGGARRPLGAAVLVNDAGKFLYPLVQSWPVPSRTAETLLVRRDGDDVLFLNDLRHQPNAALRLRIPLSRADLPAGLAIRGHTGVVRGRDYRGVDVLAALRPVGGASWFMVAKVDVAEALAAWHREAGLILAVMAGLAGLVCVTAYAGWQQARKIHYRALYGAETARRVGEARYGITLRSIGDAVIVTDAHGRVELLNPVAETLTGWRHDEARGKLIEAVFRIVNEGSREPAESPVARVLRDGVVVGLANHTVLIARDGTERPIADSGAPIRAAGSPETGEPAPVTGVVLVFRDQTAERAAQEALRRLAARLEAILGEIPDIVMEVDANKVYTWANPAGYAFFGDDVLGREASHYFVGVQETYAKVTPLFAGDSSVFYVESWQRRRDGQERLLAWWCRALKDADGRVTGALSTARDITDQRQAQETLARERALLRTLIDNLPDYVYSKDRDGRFVVANHAVARGMGCRTPDELLGKTDSDYYPRDLAARYRADEVEVIEFGRSLIGREEPVLDAAGNQQWFATTKVPLRDGAGSIVGLVGIGRDITAHRRAEEEIARTAAEWQATFDAANDAIWILDRDHRVVRSNRTSERIFPCPRAELIGKRCWEVVHGTTQPVPECPAVRARASGARQTMEFQLDGKWFQVTVDPILDAAGQYTGAVHMVSDITARKRAEAEHERLQVQLTQAQKMDAIGRLAGGVAHDFNNLLTGIMSYAGLCRDGLPADHPVRPWIDEITREAQRSADLTRQLLAFARRQVVTPAVLDLNDALSGMLKLLRRLIGEGIDLVWLPGPELWSVRIDPGQVDQIVVNLCINARDAITGAGRIVIETGNANLDEIYCAEHPGAVPGAYVRLTVSDDGCGMSQDVLAHVFEPFFTTKAAGKGTGMGLATVYGIAKQNQGFVNVYSEPGKGTTFRLYLPSVPVAAKPERVPAAPPELPRGSETVLLVEDERSIRVTCQRFLQSLGYTVLAAASGAEALRLAGEHGGEIHLLITDVVLPGMAGSELATQLARARPSTKCLFMSGYTADAIAPRGVLEPGVHFLPKPFARDALARKVREALESASDGE